MKTRIEKLETLLNYLDLGMIEEFNKNDFDEIYDFVSHELSAEKQKKERTDKKRNEEKENLIHLVFSNMEENVPYKLSQLQFILSSNGEVLSAQKLTPVLTELVKLHKVNRSVNGKNVTFTRA